MKHHFLSFLLFCLLSLTSVAQNHGAVQLQHLGFATINFAETQFFLGDQLLGNADASGFFQPTNAVKKKMTVVNPLCDTLVMDGKISDDDYVFVKLKSKKGLDSTAKATYLENYVPKCGVTGIEKNVDSLAQYAAGGLELRRFLADNVKYPQTAMEYEFSGRVYLIFIVDEMGKVSCVEIAKSSGEENVDKEGLRVTKILPEFKPALKNGVAVKSIYMLPISFILQ
jgi:TonB family protein